MNSSTMNEAIVSPCVTKVSCDVDGQPGSDVIVLALQRMSLSSDVIVYYSEIITDCGKVGNF